MADRDEIVSYCNELLSVDAFADYGPNGLQVQGSAEVSRIATTVSCTLDVFARAAAAGANMLLAHHGLFWKGDSQIIDEHRRARLKTLFDADISLCGYHLPLDAHGEIGNNALLRDGLGLTALDTPFGVANGSAIGQLGRYDDPLSWTEFRERVANLVEREPLVLGAEPDQVSTVAICSGGGARLIGEAAELGADVLVTGEPREDSRAHALELGVALVAAGHYATETIGIRALGDRVAERFGVEHIFLPDENPV